MGRSRRKRTAGAAEPASRAPGELPAAADSIEGGSVAAPKVATLDKPSRSKSAVKPAAADRAKLANTAEMLVEITKDLQQTVLDDMSAGVKAALHHANGLADASRGSEDSNDKASSLAAATSAYRAEALQLMQANFAATADFARDLALSRTAAEFVQLSGAQARKGCELMLKQAEALRTFTAALAKLREDSE